MATDSGTWHPGPKCLEATPCSAAAGACPGHLRSCRAWRYCMLAGHLRQWVSRMAFESRSGARLVVSCVGTGVAWGLGLRGDCKAPYFIAYVSPIILLHCLYTPHTPLCTTASTLGTALAAAVQTTFCAGAAFARRYTAVRAPHPRLRSLPPTGALTARRR